MVEADCEVRERRPGDHGVGGSNAFVELVTRNGYIAVSAFCEQLRAVPRSTVAARTTLSDDDPVREVMGIFLCRMRDDLV